METLKREYAEDLYNQAKRQRTDSGFGIDPQGCSPLEAAKDNSVLSSSLEIEMPDEPLLASPTNDRAIVLYKPTNPELFLSKFIPRVPTIEVDMKFFAPGMLGPESLLAPDTLHQLRVLRSSPPVATTGLTSKDVSDNRLAVIPWVASPSSMPATGLKHPCTELTTASQIQSEAMEGDVDMGEDAEAMDEDGAYVLESSQPSNPTNIFGTEPWQHYGVPQPQFGSVA